MPQGSQEELDSQIFVSGAYYQVNSVETRYGYKYLGWAETKETRKSISLIPENEQLWILVYRRYRIAPLHKMWLPHIYLTNDDIPARYPRPQLPDQYYEHRVMSVLYMNKDIVGAIRIENPSPIVKSKWVTTG